MGKYSIFDPNDLVCVRFARPNGSILKIFARYLRNGSPIDEKSRPSANQIPWRVFFASETVAQKFVEYHHAGEGAAGAHDRDWETSRGNPTVTRRSTDSIRRRTFPPFVTPPRVPCRLPPVVVLTARSRIRPRPG